jgi:hypothetical protein
VDVDESVSQSRRRTVPSDDPFQNIGSFTNVNGVIGDLSYDSDFLAAMELFVQIRHTGVTLQDLMKLLRDSRHWTDPQTTPFGGVSLQTNTPMAVQAGTPRVTTGIVGHSEGLITPKRLDEGADGGEFETPQTGEGKNVLGLKADTPVQTNRKNEGGESSGDVNEGAKTEDSAEKVRLLQKLDTADGS